MHAPYWMLSGDSYPPCSKRGCTLPVLGLAVLRPGEVEDREVRRGCPRSWLHVRSNAIS
jgi:hypothetical protein